VIKYLGSKRTMVPRLGAMATALEATTAVDLFTGTTRVAQEFKRRGLTVTAADIASYSEVLGECFISTDAASIDLDELRDALALLSALPGRSGYVTRTFCEESRYFQPHNGARIDAIREALESDYRLSPLFPILLSSLILAADRVDSTTGVQMAYLKSWAPRSFRELELRIPELIAGRGSTVRGDARELVHELPRTELMYLDPPYNQHRYFTNYHVWETLVRWDRPEAYGVARKRIDSRDDASKSVFNRKREMPAAFRELLADVDAETLIVSYNDESWITAEQMTVALRDAGYPAVRLLAFDAKRYVGAQIGIHNPAGVKVGKVSHLRNTEYLFVAGDPDRVEAAAAAALAPADEQPAAATARAGDR
jgi:adenine-specific DNA-methyltransferase